MVRHSHVVFSCPRAHRVVQMNLPPEEWADEVKDLNGQLVECLEQLFEREQVRACAASAVHGAFRVLTVRPLFCPA
jgi:hypothetical protein